MHTYTRDTKQMQPAPMLLVDPNGQGDKLTMSPMSFKLKSHPTIDKTPLWGSKLTIGKSVTCSYNMEDLEF